MVNTLRVFCANGVQLQQIKHDTNILITHLSCCFALIVERIHDENYIPSLMSLLSSQDRLKLNYRRLVCLLAYSLKQHGGMMRIKYKHSKTYAPPLP
ncbi:hypothetical protein CCR75_007398 [Bremia lactucae]|uniref:Uncharacterized protein n=1 Tax=Bremia lactucae TaxID=4779 RepID=A0A976IK69_BRELC|nr:hypothetical protein CCR75_007398 [Bremia lactucae]